MNPPQRVWLFYYQAALSPNSPMNLDGSDWVFAVALVPAASLSQALARFELSLQQNAESLLQLYKCEQWPAPDYPEELLAKNLDVEASRALATDRIYQLGISSEAWAMDPKP